MTRLRLSVRRSLYGPIVVAIAALLLGTLIGRYRVFPYQILAAVKHAFGSAEAYPSTSSPTYVDRLALFASTDGRADLVMLGDSIVANGDWIDLAHGVPLANRAIEGDTIEGLRARLDDVLRLRPTRAFLMIGVNDFLENRSVDEAYRDYIAVLDTLQSEGISVVVQATLRVGTRNPYFYELNTKIDELNSRLAQVATLRGFTFFDTNASLAPKGVLRGKFTEDGVHLNYRGYVCWIAALRGVHGNERNDERRAAQNSHPDCDLSSSPWMVSN